MPRFLYIVSVLFLMLVSAPAQAATAMFTSPQANPEDVAGTNDFSGLLVAPGESVALVIDTPFAVNAGDSVTIFRTVFPFTTATIRIGSFNNGTPIIFETINSGFFGIFNTITGLAAAGCGAVGGCDFIEITTTGGAPFGLDAIAFQPAGGGVEFLTAVTNPIAAATPEPNSWALMLMAFTLIAWRLKARRNAQVAYQGALAVTPA